MLASYPGPKLLCFNTVHSNLGPGQLASIFHVKQIGIIATFWKWRSRCRRRRRCLRSLMAPRRRQDVGFLIMFFILFFFHNANCVDTYFWFSNKMYGVIRNAGNIHFAWSWSFDFEGYFRQVRSAFFFFFASSLYDSFVAMNWTVYWSSL